MLLALAIIALFFGSVSGLMPFLTAITLDLNRGDEIKVQTALKDNSSPEGPLSIVQVEDNEGYTVFLSFKRGMAQSDGQTLAINWLPENTGMYSVRTFVWSSFENPVPVDSLVREMRIDVNEVNRVVCSGSAACFTGMVTRIIDGDTLDIGDIRIRLALVNSPEIDEEGYFEAKDFTSTTCPVGSQVLVDEDDGQLEGSFGRMIAKVTCADNNLNAEILKNSHASLLTEFCDESEFASEGWVQECVATASVIVREPPETTLEETNCDPSYPTVCIPPPPPDLDCGEISYRKFKVLSPDPHRFDSDKDGMGCES